MTAGLALLRLWEFHFLELVRGLEQWLGASKILVSYRSGGLLAWHGPG